MVVKDAASVGGERTKVLDFGIAKLNVPSRNTRGTRDDLLMGTPGYMSPEQCKGAASVDDKSDVYSFGVMLYRLICGRLPFVAKGAGEVMAAHIYEQAPSLSKLSPWLPARIAEFVHVLLDKDKDHRPTMAEIVPLLDELLPLTQGIAIQQGVYESSSASLPYLPLDDASLSHGDGGADSDSVMPTVNAPSEQSQRALQSTPSATFGWSMGLSTRMRRRRQRQRLLIGLLAGLGVLAVAGGSWWWRKGPTVDPLAQPQTKIAAPPEVKPQIAGETLPPQRVTWSIQTTPVGAEVIRVRDGQILGTTPFGAELTAKPGHEELRLHLSGYVDQLVQIDSAHSSTRTFELEPFSHRPIAQPDPLLEPGPGSKTKGHRQVPGKKGGNVRIEFED